MSRIWGWCRAAGGLGILAVLVWRVGTDPFLDAVPMIDSRSLTVVVAISVGTTVCCAWRWRLVAGALGIAVSLPRAVAAYYRSLFLNTTLPGGVLGDVHRGWRHGRDTGDVSRGVRAVAWERVAGQVVQAALAVLVLLALPSPVRPDMPVAGAGAAVALAAGVLLVLPRVVGRTGGERIGGEGIGGEGIGGEGIGGERRVSARLARAAAGDLRHGLLARRVWPGVVLASSLAVAGHAAVFVIAARVAGCDASVLELLPLALLVLLAMGVPMNVAGWGPREGMAAWAFSAAGLGAAQGVATAVVYGVMTIVACLPGAVVLLVGGGLRRRRPGTEGAWRPAEEGVAHA